MRIDPWTDWPDGFPYVVLADAGVTPTSSMKEIKDAGFHLTAGGMTPEKRRAWDGLRVPDRRLAVDFFLLRQAPETSDEPR